VRVNSAELQTVSLISGDQCLDFGSCSEVSEPGVSVVKIGAEHLIGGVGVADGGVSTDAKHGSEPERVRAVGDELVEVAPDGPYLDGSGPRAGYLRSDFDRFVEVLAVDQAVAADLLLGLRKRAVRDQDLAVANLDGRRVARRAQTRARS